MVASLEQSAVEVREQCVATKLRQATRAITQHYDEAMADAGLRSTQFTLLVALAQAPLVPLSKLAEALVMDRTTLTRNLAPLLRDGLAAEHAAGDRRVRAFTLTAKGKKLLEHAMPGWRKAQARLQRALGTADLTVLDRILNAAVRAAQHG
jgi:DNA-binding MarR family transcriptional regulator